ncbi:SusD family protein [compost metagenome]
MNRLTTSTGTTYNYPFKYKVKSNATLAEYDVVLRLAEQYLIRSEARAGQNKLIGPNSASSDLNIIRERAGLSPITISTQEQFVNVILNERKSELFTEWGHRWLDIKRLKKVDDIMNTATVQKGNVWKSYQQLYPIPFQDIQLGPNLKQNIGY